MHLVVLYGYQGADSSAEQLQLTHQLFDAALSEIAGGGQRSDLPDCWRFQRGAHKGTFPG